MLLASSSLTDPRKPLKAHALYSSLSLSLPPPPCLSICVSLRLSLFTGADEVDRFFSNMAVRWLLASPTRTPLANRIVPFADLISW